VWPAPLHCRSHAATHELSWANRGVQIVKKSKLNRIEIELLIEKSNRNRSKSIKPNRNITRNFIKHIIEMASFEHFQQHFRQSQEVEVRADISHTEFMGWRLRFGTLFRGSSVRYCCITLFGIGMAKIWSFCVVQYVSCPCSISHNCIKHILDLCCCSHAYMCICRSDVQRHISWLSKTSRFIAA